LELYETARHLPRTTHCCLRFTAMGSHLLLIQLRHSFLPIVFVHKTSRKKWRYSSKLELTGGLAFWTFNLEGEGND